MRRQDELFDGARGEQLKIEGMSRAEEVSDYLSIAREYARTIARERGVVTADDVGRAMRSDGLPDSLGPAAGSLFRGPDWEWTGERKKSTRIKNHSRELRVWRLVKR